MNKRIYHLAVEWGVDSFEMMTALEEMNSKYKNHFEVVDKKEADTIHSLLKGYGMFGTPEPVKVEKPRPKPKPKVAPKLKAPSIVTPKPKAISRAEEPKVTSRPKVEKGSGVKIIKALLTLKEDGESAESKSQSRTKRKLKKEVKKEKARPQKPQRSKFQKEEDRQNNVETVSSYSDSIRRTLYGAMQHSGKKSTSQRKVRKSRPKSQWGRKVKKKKISTFVKPTSITVKLPTTLKDLSALSGIKANDLIVSLMKGDFIVTQNQLLTKGILDFISEQFSLEIKVENKNNVEESVVSIETKNDKKKTPRCPVVTIMGHVDHGKTTLLDYIRKAKTPVAGSEAGGITQHIGAYVAEHNDRPITFIDTPGHAAFTQMRSRGAKVTDVVVLVIAADDGIKPQTKEAIAHAKDAGVEIIVAINKIDKDNADIDKAMQDLATNGLQPVEWGGSVEVVKTSAIKGTGVDELLDIILDVSDILELKADGEGKAFGYILESKKTEKRGIVTTVLTKGGMLRNGDFVISGCSIGKIKKIIDSNSKSLKEVSPGLPVEIIGLNEVPRPGDKFYVCEPSEAKAIQHKKEKEIKASRPSFMSVTEDLFNVDTTKKISLVIRGDVQGSLEVLKEQLPALSNSEVQVEIKQALLGNVSENDILLAQIKDSIVIAFNTSIEPKAKELAKQRSKPIEIKEFDIIYRLIDFILQRIENSLDAIVEEVKLGELIVRTTFKSSRLGVIAGCFVDSGIVKKGAMGRVSRNNKVIHEGEITSLKRFKDDAKEVKEGFECGVKFKGFEEIKDGDTIEAYELKTVRRTLDQVE